MTLLSARSVALLFALGLAPAVPSLAQTEGTPPASSQTDAPPVPPDGGPRHGGPEHRLEMLQKNLGLSTEQTAQVKAIFEVEHSKMEALRANTSLAQQDRHTQMMAIHGDETAKIRAVLTPDQVTKYDAMESRMRQHRPGNGEGPPPPPAGGDPGNR